MGKRSDRLGIIRRIISEELISSQDELISILSRHGIVATQSTLSRDLKLLNVSKVPNNERGYIYALSDSIGLTPTKPNTFGDDVIVNVRFSGNIGVVATKSGYASAVAIVIDNNKTRDILGTVAGDNTVIMVLREGVNHTAIVEQLHAMFHTKK